MLDPLASSIASVGETSEATQTAIAEAAPETAPETAPVSSPAADAGQQSSPSAAVAPAKRAPAKRALARKSVAPANAAGPTSPEATATKDVVVRRAAPKAAAVKKAATSKAGAKKAVLPKVALEADAHKAKPVRSRSSARPWPLDSVVNPSAPAVLPAAGLAASSGLPPPAPSKAVSKPAPIASPKDGAKGKTKLVHDSFAMPQPDYSLIALLKGRARGFKRPTKKSELLRAGLHWLAQLKEGELQAALGALAPLKRDRPKDKAR